MATYTISRLAREFGLSRSTLLYYDRIGLLSPGRRTEAGYRHYTEADRERLQRLCTFRQAGLALEDIRTILARDGNPPEALVEKRLEEITGEISKLKAQQGRLSQMLTQMAATGSPPTVDKAMWIDMLRAAGMDAEARERWHTEFEARAPQAHHEFLRSLGIPEEEVELIRRRSREGWEGGG